MKRGFAIIFAAFAVSACGAVPLPHSTSETRPPRSVSGAAVMPPARVAQQCLAKLGLSGSQFAILPDQYFGGGCSTLNSVQMSDLRSDMIPVAISNLGPVACPTANSFAAWGRFGVDRAARQILGSNLVRIETMGSYSCRDVAGTGRRSAHSRAEAIDVAAFVLADGRRISVLGDWFDGTDQERQFLRTVHRSACRRFDTVLGPDYNIAHHDHIHLEAGQDGEADDGFCR